LRHLIPFYRRFRVKLRFYLLFASGEWGIRKEGVGDVADVCEGFDMLEFFAEAGAAGHAAQVGHEAGAHGFDGELFLALPPVDLAGAGLEDETPLLPWGGGR
jgi:hypothetical protein